MFCFDIHRTVLTLAPFSSFLPQKTSTGPDGGGGGGLGIQIYSEIDRIVIYNKPRERGLGDVKAVYIRTIMFLVYLIYKIYFLGNAGTITSVTDNVHYFL